VARTAPLKGVGYGRNLSYRLTLICDKENKAGVILLAWSPVPRHGELQAAVYGGTGLNFVFHHEEPMANGDPYTSPHSSRVLKGPAKMEAHPQLAFPQDCLSLDELLLIEVIEFSSNDIREEGRSQLSACFVPAWKAGTEIGAWVSMKSNNQAGDRLKMLYPIPAAERGRNPMVGNYSLIALRESLQCACGWRQGRCDLVERRSAHE